MNIRRSSRSLLIALPLVGAATLGLAWSGPGPGGFRRPVDRRIQEHLPGVGLGRGRDRDRQERDDALRHEAHGGHESRRPGGDGAGETGAARTGDPGARTKHSVEIIDDAKPGEVGVIVMEGTLDIAAMGNLMATAAVERGMAGMVLDGAIRDLWDVRRMGLTVYARSKSPRTAVGHYATVAKNVAVECAGVTVRQGDIIVADEDGVVVVPQERAAEILKEAQAIDDRERGMYPFIREFKSLQKAIAKFNRI